MDIAGSDYFVLSVLVVIARVFVVVAVLLLSELDAATLPQSIFRINICFPSHDARGSTTAVVPVTSRFDDDERKNRPQQTT